MPSSYYSHDDLDSPEQIAEYATDRMAEMADRAGGADVLEQDRRALRISETPHRRVRWHLGRERERSSGSYTSAAPRSRLT